MLCVPISALTSAEIRGLGVNVLLAARKEKRRKNARRWVQWRAPGQRKPVTLAS